MYIHTHAPIETKVFINKAIKNTKLFQNKVPMHPFQWEEQVRTWIPVYKGHVTSARNRIQLVPASYSFWEADTLSELSSILFFQITCTSKPDACENSRNIISLTQRVGDHTYVSQQISNDFSFSKLVKTIIFFFDVTATGVSISSSLSLFLLPFFFSLFVSLSLCSAFLNKA